MVDRRDGGPHSEFVGAGDEEPSRPSPVVEAGQQVPLRRNSCRRGGERFVTPAGSCAADGRISSKGPRFHGRRRPSECCRSSVADEHDGVLGWRLGMRRAVRGTGAIDVAAVGAGVRMADWICRQAPDAQTATIKAAQTGARLAWMRRPGTPTRSERSFAHNARSASAVRVSAGRRSYSREPCRIFARRRRRGQVGGDRSRPPSRSHPTMQY